MIAPLAARFRSVRQKLFAAVLFTSIVALVLTAGSLFLYDLHSYRKISSTDLSIEADVIGYATTAALQFDDRAVASTNLAFLEARPNVRAAAIYDARGQIFAGYLRGGVKEPLPRTPGLIGGVIIDGSRIEVFRRMQRGGETLGTVYLLADLDIRDRVATYIAIAVVVAVAALAIALLLSARLQSAIARPIGQISGLAREVVAKRDYSVRATRTTNDEIGTLAEAFNEMLSEIEQRTAALESTRDEVSRLNADLERRVTERTAQLEESNVRLREADAAKSRFLSMMSHEIRTPMNGVLGMLELLGLSGLNTHQQTSLNVVRESARSLLRIIDDILDFSKIEAGKLEVRPEPASIHRIVGNVIGVYAGNASSKSLTLRSFVDPRISTAVMVDPVRLQQILNNLVSNAIKFTSTGFVELRAERLDHRDESDIVRFSVLDSGMGISPEDQARLFQPFTQASSGVKHVAGTGLGLSIGQRLAGLMGGSIAMHSELGKGTTMIVTLPLPVTSADALEQPGGVRGSEALATVPRRREAPNIRDAEREGTLVLVVDDHPINRLVLLRQVTLLGYAAESANDGREALAMWRSGRFRLLVTDCNMPEMDGYELARAIRAEEMAANFRRTTLIACTANALRGEAENCLAAGMDDYLSKPVEMVALAAKLDQWLPLSSRSESNVSPAAPETSEPIDRSVLAQISGGHGDLEVDALDKFRQANEEDALMLAKALASRDFRQTAGIAHRMRGASNAVGAIALGNACEAVERAAKEGDWPTVIASEPALRAELARLDAYFSILTGTPAK